MSGLFLSLGVSTSGWCCPAYTTHNRAQRTMVTVASSRKQAVHGSSVTSKGAVGRRRRHEVSEQHGEDEDGHPLGMAIDNSSNALLFSGAPATPVSLMNEDELIAHIVEEEEVEIVEEDEQNNVIGSMPLVHSTRRCKGAEDGVKKNKVNSQRSLHLVQHGHTLEDQGLPLQYRNSSGVQYMEDIASDTDFLMNIRSWLHSNRKSKRVRRKAKGVGSSSSSVTSFLVSLGNTPVLSAKQEKRLALIIARGKTVREAAKQLAREKKQRPSLHDVALAAGLETAHDAARAVMLAEDARALMVEFNLRMVISIAKKYCGKGVELGDLIPEGLLGLRKAIDKFDATKGFKFSTYSHWWIRQAISRAVSDQGRDIRLPVHVVEFLSKVKRVSAELEADPERSGPPTHRELAAAMGVPLPRLVALLQAAKNPKGTGEGMSGNFSSNVGNLGVDLADEDLWTTDEEGVNPVAEVERAEFLQETLSLMLSTLPLRERNVLRLRYGLHSAASANALKEVASELMILGEDVTSDDEEDMMSGLGLKEVGVIHQLCRERIRQIETDALRHLRVPWRINILKSVRAGKPLTPESIDRMLQATNEANQNLL
jgi:RNA polymerase primary sigma factor